MSETPFDRFKEFVSEILAVTKEDIRKAKEGAADLVKPREAEPDEEC